MSENAKYEQLAARLLEDPSASWPEPLQPLRTEVRVMPSALRDRLLEMSAEAERTPAAPAGKLLFFGSRSFARLALAATVTAAFGIGLYVYLGVLPGGAATEVQVAFVQGQVTQNGKAVRRLDALGEGQRLEVGPGALAVLRATNPSMQADLRLGAGAVFSAQSLASGPMIARMERGVAFARVRRSGANSPPDDSNKPVVLALVAPSAELSVTGTEFSFGLNDLGDVRVATFEGEVRFRKRLAALEDLPAELIARSELLTDALAIIGSAVVVVPAGAQSTVSASAVARGSATLELLPAALSEKAVAGLRGRQQVSDAELKAALAAIERHIATAAQKQSCLGSVRRAFGVPPVVQRVGLDQLESEREDLQRTSTAERDARYEELRAAGMPQDRAAFARQAKRILGKAPQEIVLKNGETIFGTVFGLDGRYRVYTAKGIRTLAPAEIEEIKF